MWAHRRHPTSNRAGHVFNLSETVPANAENGGDRARPEDHAVAIFFVARDSPAFPSRGKLRSLNATNKSRERNDEG